MNIDTTILGYIIDDCHVICDDCAEKNDQYTVEVLVDPENTVLNVYNTEDWQGGLNCDDCHEFIVEVWNEEDE